MSQEKGSQRRGLLYAIRGEIAVSRDPPVNLPAAFAAARDGEATLSFQAGSLEIRKQPPALLETPGGNVNAGI